MTAPAGDLPISADSNRFAVQADGFHLVGTDCALCDTVVLGTQRACLRCGSASVSRAEVAHRGHVLSYTIVHRPAEDWWGPVPYTLAEVETADGVVVVASVHVDDDMTGGAGAQNSARSVRIGDAVELRQAIATSSALPEPVVVYQWQLVGGES